jgi:MYXO-CTERM domain-containing protein
MKTLATLALLSVCAMWPVGSASADTVKVDGTKYTLGETAEANGDIIFAPFTTNSKRFKPGAGVVLTDGNGNSDVLFYTTTPLGSGFEFKSATNKSLTGNFSGFTFIPESSEHGKALNVGSVFGLGNGQVKVFSADATPLPPSWTIMMTGLVGLGLLLHRRRQPSGVEGTAGMAVA